MKKLLFTITLLFLSCGETKTSNECDEKPDYFLLRPEVEKAYGYSHAVKICNQIKVSGAVSMDQNGSPTAIGDMKQQMINCYKDLKKILDHYDSSFEDVVVENIFTTGSWLGVNQLALPGFLIEIELEVHLNGNKSEEIYPDQDND